MIYKIYIALFIFCFIFYLWQIIKIKINSNKWFDNFYKKFVINYDEAIKNYPFLKQLFRRLYYLPNITIIYDENFKFPIIELHYKEKDNWLKISIYNKEIKAFSGIKKECIGVRKISKKEMVKVINNMLEEY